MGTARTLSHLAKWLDWLGTTPADESWEFNLRVMFNQDGFGARPQILVVDDHMACIDKIFHAEETVHPGEVSFFSVGEEAFAQLAASIEQSGRHASRRQFYEAKTPRERFQPVGKTVTHHERDALSRGLSLGVLAASSKSPDEARRLLEGEIGVERIELPPLDSGLKCTVEVSARREFVEPGGRTFIELAVTASCNGAVEEVVVTVGEYASRYEGSDS